MKDINKITSNGTDWCPMPADTMHWEAPIITSVVFLPNMPNLNPIMRKYQINQNWKTLLAKHKNKNTGLYSFKISAP